MTKSKSLAAFMRARVDSTDEAHLDPGQRAELVNTFIFHALGLNDPKDAAEQPLYWDLLCYSFQMISLYAIQMQDKEFTLFVKEMHNFMHGIHYSGVIGEESFLGPARDEHEKLWVDRIEESLYRVEGLQNHIISLEQDAQLPPDQYSYRVGFDEGWTAAHENAPCGHARANWKDPNYGTTKYKGEEECEFCAAIK